MEVGIPPELVPHSTSHKTPSQAEPMFFSGWSAPMNNINPQKPKTPPSAVQNPPSPQNPSPVRRPACALDHAEGAAHPHGRQAPHRPQRHPGHEAQGAAQRQLTASKREAEKRRRRTASVEAPHAAWVLFSSFRFCSGCCFKMGGVLQGGL